MTLKKDLRIGEFITERLGIPASALEDSLQSQVSLNKRIGELALSEGFIIKNDRELIMSFQERHKTHFGTSGVSLGILKNAQVSYLLDIQARSKNRIGELLLSQSHFSPVDLMKILDDFYSMRQNKFSILSFLRPSLSQEIEKHIKPELSDF